jgi:enoyl-CoA hydratase/carnithine racemase
MEEILVERDNNVATVTINRPDQRNAINYHMWMDLQRIVVDLTLDHDVRVVIFKGAGKQAFSAGADIKDFELYRNNATKAKLHEAAVTGALDAIAWLPKPTISMIRGFCIGGGCELAIATDIRVATKGSRFGIPVARLGILIASKEMRRLVDLVGRGNAMYILMSARLLETEEALRIGLINQEVEDDELENYAYKLASEMAALAPLSHSGNKQILHTILANPDMELLTLAEQDFQLSNFDSADFQEGRRAFLEKRKPKFEGR